MKLYYESCDILPVFNFFKIVDTNNYNWLIEGYRGGEQKVDESLPSLWAEIFDEYITLKGDESTMDYYRGVADMVSLESKKQILEKLAYIYSIAEGDDALKSIADILFELGYPIDLKDSFKDNEARLARSIKGLVTNINRKKSQHEDVYKKKEAKTKRNFEKDVADIEFLLNKNFIDTKKVTVARWLGYLKQAEAKIKATEKNGKG